MTTFLAFIAGVGLGVSGLIGTFFFLMWKYPHEPEPKTVLVSYAITPREFYKDTRGNYRLREASRHSTDRMTDEIIAEHANRIKIEFSADPAAKARQEERLNRTRIHETGHLIIALLAYPDDIVWMVASPHIDPILKEFHAGAVRMESAHDPDIDFDIIFSYGGVIAEELILGSAFNDDAYSDLSHAYTTSYALACAKDGMAAEPSPWPALGACNQEDLNNAAMNKTVVVCQTARHQTRKILKREHPALMAFVEALEKKPVLLRHEILEIWNQQRSPESKETPPTDQS